MEAMLHFETFRNDGRIDTRYIGEFFEMGSVSKRAELADDINVVMRISGSITKGIEQMDIINHPEHVRNVMKTCYQLTIQPTLH